MFIHWGIYSLTARAVITKYLEETTDEDYQRYFDHFDPDLYDPALWAKTAREAGMKYFVITTKQHDGFCMWDTKFTDYKVTNTPYGKDLIRPMVEAFRAEGLKVGFYHSLIDWHHPDFTIDTLHPQRNHPDAIEMNKSRDMSRYLEYLYNQTRELLTDFGKIDIMWFDYSYPDEEHKGLKGKGRDDWQSEKLLKMVRELQPNVILNNRLDLPADAGADILTPEQFQPTKWMTQDGQPKVWEACQTFNGEWCYNRDEGSWKSPQQLIQMLVNSVSCGGNLLMNVGPTARGNFDHRALSALGDFGDWMKLHERSIYSCTQSEFAAPADVRYTQNFQTNRLYVHVFAWSVPHLHLPGLAGKVECVQLLNDASEVRTQWIGDSKQIDPDPSTLTLYLPVTQPNVVVPVLELFLKNKGLSRSTAPYGN